MGAMATWGRRDPRVDDPDRHPGPHANQTESWFPQQCDPWLERDPKFGEARSIYCLDTDQLVCATSLLNEGSSSYTNRHFKSVMADLNDTQRRVLRRMIVAKGKRKEVDEYVTELEQLKRQTQDEAQRARESTVEVLRSLQRELSQVQDALIQHLNKTEEENVASITEQSHFCETLRVDMNDALALAKDYLSSDHTQAKAPAVVHSIEMGLDEVNAAELKPHSQLRSYGSLDTTGVLSALANLSFTQGNFPSARPYRDGKYDRNLSAPAYGRLQRVAMRQPDMATSTTRDYWEAERRDMYRN